MKKIYCLPFILFFITQFLLFTNYSTFAQPKTPPRYEDAIYESNIKTAAIYPQPNNLNDPARTLYPAVISLEAHKPLMAEFDDLRAQYRSFRFKIFHCNADWTRSTLNEIEFTYEYNDYPINDYQASFNSKIPYYHYRFDIPRLKLSGNYLLLVYEDSRPAKPILSKRFMVYEPRVSLAPQVRFSMGITEQRTHQQVDFDLDHKGYDIVAPDYLKIIIRQNFRWNRVLTNIKPSSVQAFQSRIEYRPIDLSNNFWAGNEFRWFDTRSAYSTGISVADIKQLPDQTAAYLRTDQPRSGQGAFMQADDFNGNFVILNRETSNSTNEVEYINVVFALKTNEITDGQVYVNGAFNDWQCNNINRMTYNHDKGLYEASIFIKQGLVNYNYAIVRNNQLDDSSFEGNFSGSSNDYEIFVYYRGPAARTDALVGYRLVEFGR
jgi:Domain of unknown function (DUF5103)